MRDDQEARENSLYEAVETDVDYVDACLRHFLGRVIKCRTVEELEQVRDGVTADCYSYSNYTLRHLYRKDYRDNACIGKAIPKSRIEQLEAEVKELEETGRELTRRIAALEQARSYENLSQENGYYPVSYTHLDVYKRQTLLQNAPEDDPVYRFLDKKRAQGKPYYVYMTAGANKFLRIYYGKVKECLRNLEQAE